MVGSGSQPALFPRVSTPIVAIVQEEGRVSSRIIVAQNRWYARETASRPPRYLEKTATTAVRNRADGNRNASYIKQQPPHRRAPDEEQTENSLAKEV